MCGCKWERVSRLYRRSRYPFQFYSRTPLPSLSPSLSRNSTICSQLFTLHVSALEWGNLIWRFLGITVIIIIGGQSTCDDDYTDNSLLLVWILFLCLLIRFRALLLLCGVLTCPIPGITITTTSLRTRPFVRHRHHVGDLMWEWERYRSLCTYVTGPYILECWGHQNRAEQLIPCRCVGGKPNPALSQSKREYL